MHEHVEIISVIRMFVDFGALMGYTALLLILLFSDTALLELCVVLN